MVRLAPGNQACHRPRMSNRMARIASLINCSLLIPIMCPLAWKAYQRRACPIPGGGAPWPYRAHAGVSHPDGCPSRQASHRVTANVTQRTARLTSPVIKAPSRSAGSPPGPPPTVHHRRRRARHCPWSRYTSPGAFVRPVDGPVFGDDDRVQDLQGMDW
jgi:hypothetical protein